MIILTTTNTGSYSWTVPDSISIGVRVKVSDVADANAFAASAANFKIKGKLTVTAPNGSEAWPINTNQNITWTKVGSIANVKLEYSTNGFSDELQTFLIAASVNAATGTPYSWLIPDKPSANVKVRITDVTDATVFSLSTNPFSIKGSLWITSPNGGETWVVGATNNITWTKFGSIANVELRYSTDGGSTYPVGNIIIASTPAAGLSYSWTIPDAIGNQLRVKIADTGDVTVYAASAANFGIRGSVNLTSPVGGETWIVGENRNVTWTKAGSFANVKLEYSTNGFSNELQTTVITASTLASPLTYAWTVPDAIGTNLKVRISDASDSTVVSTSTGAFTIKGNLLLTSPVGAETWIVGESRNITWNRTGSIANVKLEYSTDSGVTYPNIIIASTPAAAGTYAWTVADAIGTNLKIRITDATDATVLSVSTAAFTVKGSLTLTAPNGGETWVVGSSHNIIWAKTGTIATVKLEYSTNAFADELQTVVITASTDATGTPPLSYAYSWTIPDTISSTVKVRITNNADSSVTAKSATNFKISGSFTLTAPNGAEAWTVGKPYSITWTKSGSIANAKLEYSTNGGATYPDLIVASTPAAGLSYSWTIPDAIGSQVRVKISDATDATVSAASAANFTILGGFTVTAPNGGEVWAVGESRNITWTTAGTVANVKLEYSTDSGLTYPNVIILTAVNMGTYSWTVPDSIATSARVKVSDVADANAFAASAANFKIRGSLNLTSPAGGEIWIVGSPHNITWTKVGSIANAKLEYSTDGGTAYPNTIVVSTPAAAGTYAWTIPDTIGTNLKVRISDVSDATVLSSSTTPFSIKGSLTVTSPNGGENWVVGGSHNITWTKIGTIVTVKLEYSTNGGGTYPNVIALSADATSGTPYSWTIPDTISSSVKVRVTNNADATVFATSAADFKITGSFTLTAPNGAEKWTVGTSQTITWTKTGSIANAKLEYSTDGGATYPNLIVASTLAANLTYDWTIPDAVGIQARVRISDVSDAAVLAASAANFSILGGFNITSPNGGEVWTVGSLQDITWTTSGTVGNVKLEYSTDGGATYPNLIAVSVTNTGTYSWTIPDVISTTLRVKVSDVNNSNAFKTSSANFKIRGGLTITAPVGTESWIVGIAHNITWAKTGTINTVKLEYSTDGGATYPNVIATLVNAVSGTPYSWTVPDNLSTMARVKITNEADSTVFTNSAANFSIRGSLALTAPNGAETWVVGNTSNITWTKVGSIANVKIEYSTDGGLTYPNLIVASTPAASLSYAWTVPDSIGTALRVKVTDITNSTVFVTSAADFAIKGSVTLTSPFGGETWYVGENRNVTWTRTGSFVNVKLEYSKNGFSDELQTVLIAASTPAAALSYAWTVPDAIGTSLKVRISDAADSTVVSVSTGAFIIKGKLTLTSPIGAETWIVGQSQNITWTKTGTVANVKLEYSTDAGVTYPNIITVSTPAVTGTYAWTIPDSIGIQLRVRVTDASDATVFAASAANFTIKGSLTITAPVGGESWVVGTAQNITWSRTGSIANIKLEYSTNGFSDELATVTIVASTDATGTPAGTYKYTWTIPDAISSTVKVRITNTSDAAVTSRSATNFKITGSFALTAPNGAEQWTVGTVQAITWTKVGSVVNAKLEYSTNGGATYPNIIIASTPAGGLSYSWTIPDAVSPASRVKISDASDATVFAASAADFSIRGGFTITAPNGGEVWIVGESRNITWTTVGSVANVKLEYSTDGGVTYPNIIIASTLNAGMYAWTVPDVISATLKIKVSDVNNAQAFAVSANNFKICGAFAITSPNGAEQWIVGNAQNITWNTTGTIGNIKLEYSTNGFADELQTVLIVASTPNAGTYSWTIPDAISSTVKARITNVADSTVFKASAANFTIKGSLTVTAPVGGEVWIVGNTNNITWAKTGSIANVKLEYSRNGFLDELQTVLIAASTPAVSLSYAWTVPDDIGTTLKVRISDVSNATVTNISSADFAIKGSLTITVPNGAEIWKVGESRNITWAKTGTIANVKLEYSTDAGATYPNIIIASTDATLGTYAWTVPDAIGTSVRVKITNVADAAVFKASAANFEIKGSLTITSPNGGEVWKVENTQPITWSKAGTIANVKIEYSTDGGVTYPNTIILSAPAAAGSYSWLIPDAISNTVRIKITSTSDPEVSDISDANFKISGSLVLVFPNGGESWVIASSQNITWAKTGSIASAKLEYSTDSGLTYPNLIVASVDATLGAYAWTVPDVPSTTVRVKITNTADATVFNTSAANFRIRGSFTLTSPVGGETWIVGQSRDITWTKAGSIANAKLEYSIDGGSTYPNLIASTPAANLVYAWTIPDAIGSALKVRISDAADSAVFSSSAANFAIKGSLTIAVPNGAEIWKVGESRNITWAKTGTIANVKLEYSTDAGATYPNIIIASTDATLGTYAWTVPDAIGTSVRVKITNILDSTVTAASNANFEIKGSLSLTVPAGGEIWAVGSVNNITWNRTGSIANVKIEYSTDGGLSYLNTIILSTPAAAGTYAWTIPDAIGSQLRVKITDVSDTTVISASNANFKITGSFTITSPVGAEVWIVGANQNITWTKTGSIANAKLEYSTDGGVTYPPGNLITVSVPANLGSYTWAVPDNISSTVKVKISDVADATVFSASASNFKIAGSFTMTSPVGGEKWPIGSAQGITWTKTGSILNAKLQYSTDGGVTYPYVIIATTPAANLSYSWTIPNNPSTTCRVKITDITDSTVFAASSANFKIMGSFTLTAPNGGEVWVVGETRDIVWTTVGSIANVKLEYSTDGGATYPNSIIASTPNTGSYSWTIPDAIGTTLRVKITDVLDPDAKINSAANFKIRGSLTVVTPNGGEAWIVASSQNIAWTKSGSVANVKIEYSTDGGATYPVGNLIAASVNAATGTPFAWTIPDAISTTVKVKITNTTDATVYGESSGNFTIRGGFTVTSPNGSEKWTVGASKTITWTTFGTIANARLEYSTDGGATYPNLIVASTSNTGSYNWIVPSAISSTCKVRVSNAADPGTFAVSSANFKIMGGFSITLPVGGEVFVVGSSQAITWATAGTVANAKLEYSTDGGVTYPNAITLSTPNTNSYNWVVPDAISTIVRVKVSDASDPDAFGASAGNFKIRAGFALISPAGGEAWIVASAHDIAWTTSGTVANVKLEYSTDSGVTYPNIIIASVANAGTYAWTVPDAITTAARVRVSDVNDSTASSSSSTNFKIQGSLTLTSPVGGEAWVVSSIHTITWNRVGSIANVKLEYSTDGGALYAPIVASTANTGSYSWAVPDNISTTVKVRVTDTNDATVNSASTTNFKIQAGFSVTSPNGGQNWLVGSNQTITWVTQGTAGFVKLDYSTDGGATYPSTITTSTANTGTYSWTVPDSVSGFVRVRVMQTTDATAYGTSAANFRIRTTFTLTSPTGGQQWLVGNTYNITWTAVGTIPNVKLEYSRDGFLTDKQLINAAAPAIGAYSWVIPDAISNTVRVRVSDPDDIGAYKDSTTDFKITARFTITSPNGAEKWDVGSTQNIAWTWSGAVPTAKIEYSTNGGATYPNVIAATANTGTYAWTVPDTITAAFRVRVSDLADSTAYDISDADVKIRAKFSVTSPSGGEIWTVNESKNITWTTIGTVANVRLDYSTDGGSTYPNVITLSAANAGTYSWTVPDAISTTVKVRVMSTTDTDAFAVSGADFKIRGTLAITTPNGGELWKINQLNNITWVRTGSIANVKIEYSTNSGATYPNLIVASTPASTLNYAWTIPDVPTPSARIMITDVSDSTVFTSSSADFRIQGFFTVTSPVGGEAWIVGSTHPITWTWGGTIPLVKITYSTDGGVTFPDVINAAAPNGAGGGGSYSYAWAVPDTLSQAARVKVEDPNDDTVYGISAADFKIRGNLVLTAPNGGERWVANESHNITWTRAGSIANVKLEYSTDSGLTYPNVIIASAPAAPLSYAWTIPDDRSTTVRVRVSDATDATVNAASIADFKIDYYTITWVLRDLLTNEQLTNLSVIEKDTASLSILNWQAAGQTSPIAHQTKYGLWTATWSCSGYGDKAQNYVANSDQTFTLYMETTVIHIWRTYSEFTYNTTVDRLDVSSWLERDGSMVPGAASVQVDIYDAGVLIKSLNSSTPTAAGFFNLSWTSTGLAAGKVYTTVTQITNASGAVFRTPGSFDITTPKRLEEMQAKVNSVLDKPMSEVNTELQTTLAAQTNIINTKMTEQSTIITTKTDEMKAALESSLSSFETRSNEAITKLQSGADMAVAAGQTLEETAKKYSWKASVAPDPALTGDMITLQCQGQAGLSPTLNIYSWDNKAIIRDITLKEVSPGLYTYGFEADGRFAPGKAYTYTVTEQVTSGMVSGSGMVESMGITTVAGLAAAAPAAERAAKDALEAIKAVEAVLVSGDGINIATTLKSLKDSVDALPATFAKEGPSAKVTQAINEISDRVKKLGGDEGYDMTQLFEKALTSSPTVKEIRSKTEEIKGAVDVLQEVVETKLGGVDAPVLSTTLYPGSVRFRIVALNPSKTKSQKMDIKYYLPQEVMPKDITDMAGLDLEYDSEKSIHYVYKPELELAPGEMRVFEVEVEDIWVVPQNKISDLKSRVEQIVLKLEQTPYYSKAKEIADTIYPKLDGILSSQSDDSLSRERHIGVYRQNQDVLGQVKEDIARMEKILVTAGGPPSPEMLSKTKIKAEEPNKTMTWIVIFIIIIFMGLLGSVLFFSWHRQSCINKEELLQAKKSAFPEPVSGPEKENEPEGNSS